MTDMNRVALLLNFAIALSGVTAEHVNYRRCKWSNEDCENDGDCCSDECYLAHEGTDPRCSRSRVGMPCYADYQCENGLDCGPKYQCCAPYWGVCFHINQCCDTRHVCREEPGFPYRRCLYPNQASYRYGSVVNTLCMAIVTLLLTDLRFCGVLLSHLSYLLLLI